MKIHEVIDHSQGICTGSATQVPSPKHIFFDSEADARRYMADRPHLRMQYLWREWGDRDLSLLWIEDLRK